MDEVGISRRWFLRGVGAAAAGAVGFPYVLRAAGLGKFGAVAASERVAVGCIGMGGQGTSDMLNFLEHADAQVVAVCDVDRGRRERAAQIVNEKYGNNDCAAYNDFRQILERGDIDAVSIATPDHWHGVMGVSAAKAGKDIYAQKPLAYSIREGREIVEAVSRAGVVWQTGSQQRSDRNFRFACELVRNGRIGEVKVIRVGLPAKNMIFGDGWNTPRHEKPAEPVAVPEGFDYDMWLGPAQWKPYSAGRCHWNFRWISDYAHGQVSDWAGHHCDIAHWGMGVENSGPVEVEGSGRWPVGPIYDTVEDYTFRCRYAEGFEMVVSGGYPRGVRFEGSEGWIFVSRAGMTAEPAGLLSSRIGPDELHLYVSDDHKRNFLDCVKSRRKCVAPVEVGHRSIIPGHLGLIAMRVGREIRWDPQAEKIIGDQTAEKYLGRSLRRPWRA